MSVSVISRNLQGATEFPSGQERSEDQIGLRLARSSSCARPSGVSIRGRFCSGAAIRNSSLQGGEAGCLCVYEPQSAEHRAIVEFAFAGDLLGLGYLENHTRSARSIGETWITYLPLNAVDRLVAANPRARDQLKQAIDDELGFSPRWFSQVGSEKTQSSAWRPSCRSLSWQQLQGRFKYHYRLAELRGCG